MKQIQTHCHLIGLYSITAGLAVMIVLLIPTARNSTLGGQTEIRPKKSDRLEYVCPSCGCASDSKIFDAPGECPSCKMGLVRKEPFHERRKVAIVIFDGVDLLDIAGPTEMFTGAMSANGKAFEVFTVAADKSSMDSLQAIVELLPAYTIESSPKPDIVVIPGGREVEALVQIPRFIEWLKKAAGQAEFVLSVANGAIVAANAGLLDEHEATTVFWVAKRLQEEFPRIKVRSAKALIVDGKIATTSNSVAGMDAALRIIERIHGPEAAKNTAGTIGYAPQSLHE